MNMQTEITIKSDQSRPHLGVLDGWRGLSILFVLAAHLLPLGPHAWLLNYSIGIVGMAVFFNLSGFLITAHLLKDQQIRSFLVKRFCRVLPLAWLYLAIALVWSAAPWSTWLSHFLFYANLPPKDLLGMTEHLWSLCVEVQFYVGVALLVLLLRRPGLWLLPVLALGFTLLRWWYGVQASSISYFRIDEILAGCILALLYHHPGQFGLNCRRWLGLVPQWPLLLLLVYSSMPQGGGLNFLRPYLAAMLIGATIVAPETLLARMLSARFLIFCASISYALYVIHPILAYTWLGDTDLHMKYLKRPLFFAVLFLLAYVSTRYYESWFIAQGRKLSARWSRSQRPPEASNPATSTATPVEQPSLASTEK